MGYYRQPEMMGVVYEKEENRNSWNFPAWASMEVVVPFMIRNTKGVVERVEPYNKGKKFHIASAEFGSPLKHPGRDSHKRIRSKNPQFIKKILDYRNEFLKLEK